MKGIEKMNLSSQGKSMEKTQLSLHTVRQVIEFRFWGVIYIPEELLYSMVPEGFNLIDSLLIETEWDEKEERLLWKSVQL